MVLGDPSWFLPLLLNLRGNIIFVGWRKNITDNYSSMILFSLAGINGSTRGISVVVIIYNGVWVIVVWNKEGLLGIIIRIRC